MIVANDFFQVMPPLSAEEYAELKSDIAERGVMVPVEYDEAGCVLDGHHRVKACKELGIEKWPSVVRVGFSETEKRTHARKLNMARRHLNQEQRRGLIQAELKDRPQVSDRTIAKGLGVSPTTVGTARNQLVEKGELSKLDSSIGADGKERPRQAARSTPEPARHVSLFSAAASDKEAADLGKKAVAVIEKAAPETVERLADGAVNLVQAKREIKEQTRESRREENRAIVRQAAPLEENGARFATIVVDPPWDWGDEGDCDQLGRSRPDYATLSYGQLLELPVAKKSDTDCHLYLWITNRSLPKGFALLEAWGFRYITCLTWVKPSFGMGNYFRGQSEQVLFGVKGSQPLRRKDAGTVFHFPRGPGGHSSKPAEFYDFVESCSPGPYLEIFSRKDRPDWTAWGEAG